MHAPSSHACIPDCETRVRLLRILEHELCVATANAVDTTIDVRRIVIYITCTGTGATHAYANASLQLPDHVHSYPKPSSQLRIRARRTP